MLKPSENMIRTPHRSQYSLVIAVAKRAREIADEAEMNKEILVEKPVDLAVQDFMANKFEIIEPDPADYVDGFVAVNTDIFVADPTGELSDEEEESEYEDDEDVDYEEEV